MLNTKKTKWDFLRYKTGLLVLLVFTHCMAVQVPEDYVADLYYADQPKVMSLTPSTSMSWTTLRPTIQIKFNNPMDIASISVDTGGTCTGAIQLYDNNNSGCRALTLSTTENRNSIINVTYAADLDPNSDYIITVQGTITDFRGKALGADATYPFKSGVPSGTEPKVVSVTTTGGFTEDGQGNLELTVNFSRQMTFASIGSLNFNSCTDMFNLTNDNFVSNCNAQYNAITPAAGDASSYAIRYKNLPRVTGTYVFRVKAGLIDKFGIASVADYTFNYP